MSNWINVIDQFVLSDGDYLVTNVDDTEVAIFKIDGEYYAIEDVCTHDGGEIASGTIDGDEIVCPRHGARFCIKTGEVKGPPAYENISRFQLRIENGMIQIKSDD